ncbi:DUF4330 family protein [Natronorubrum sp. FCH18a]|uniref:DUF4330 family protein n=1 Tax=Natronorubrum sp. FCH18a TaxID=3447018 RepID=UPI003F512194
MEIIDENGNLFGAVNVVDALAVCLLVAVVVAGVAAVGTLGAEDETEADDGPAVETRYATIDLGTQSSSLAETISAGDEMTRDDHPHSLTITDVYATPVSSGAADVTVRTEVEGTQFENGTYAFGDAEFATGRNVSIGTEAYDATGTIEAVENEGTELPVAETDALLETTASSEAAADVQVGDEVRIGDETVATVETVSVYPVGDGTHRVLVGATLTTLEHEYDRRYGQIPVESGSTIPLSTADYDLDLAVLDTGVTDEPGEPTTTTVEIDLEKLGDREAGQFEPGLTETAGGETWATIEDIEREPASVIVETENGELHERHHPTKDDVTLTVELQTRETALGPRFKGSSLDNGDTVYLDFGIASIEERLWVVDD